jgi:hypothetical protein
MPQSSRNALLALLAGLLALAACSGEPTPKRETGAAATPAEDRARLGLMTSLPLYWPEGAGIAAIASGNAALPWQRNAIEQAYVVQPLDTLSPIAALSPDMPETDPLAGLDRLAVIQPRGLSPADNVALDRWVRSGGRLLLALDPALTGHYDGALGDPRRPVDNAAIPPVVARWGLAISFDDAQEPGVSTGSLGAAVLPMALSGRVSITAAPDAKCTLAAGGAAATCKVGKGRVTLIADAAMFEHRELAGDAGSTLRAVLAEAVE